jgi:hypothetical protein
MWERLKDIEPGAQSSRLKVPGGWIVRTILRYDTGEGAGCAVEQTFVADADHDWGQEQ